MLNRAALKFDVTLGTEEMEEREKEATTNSLMPKLVFATPKSCSEIKRSSK